ncbi:MAG: glycosyltransferase [Clostridium sp.]|uniref:glycosyltransferase family 2 protein n=1 Tax=Clostridium TaxID=1485 RepID=UPI0028FF7784|nr:glycosyltransferase [Clostridium sp.]MDU1978898.1 glycosyltransferase [Clostridium sp.]MDU1994328.1 glycosyltransferase [Clostridium sp.]MDU4143095.1 glycosyltransferase [Clostridium sp.]MDU6048907.1 glycosyltransferase [Clostridium sp.]MDU6223024.1 glycosyltransferase [Clostridium sp.]
MWNKNTISVVIATKNRINSLNCLLKSIYQQTACIDEIVIVDQSDENNKNFLLATPNITTNVIYIYNPNITGLTQARNIGVKNSAGDFVFFFDDDLELLNDFIENMLSKMEKHKGIAGLCGKQIINKEKSKFYLVIRELFKKGPFSFYYEKGESKNKYKYIIDSIEIRTRISGGITVYRKEVLEEFIFDENMIKYCLGEDFDFSFRVSRKYYVGINTEALAYHHHDKSGRLDYKKDFAARICFYNYFFKKNCINSEKLYLIWIKLGLWIHAFGLLFVKRTVQPLQGILAGNRMSKNNFFDSPCIKGMSE